MVYKSKAVGNVYLKHYADLKKIINVLTLNTITMACKGKKKGWCKGGGKCK